MEAKDMMFVVFVAIGILSFIFGLSKHIIARYTMSVDESLSSVLWLQVAALMFIVSALFS